MLSEAQVALPEVRAAPREVPEVLPEALVVLRGVRAAPREAPEVLPEARVALRGVRAALEVALLLAHHRRSRNRRSLAHVHFMTTMLPHRMS